MTAPHLLGAPPPSPLPQHFARHIFFCINQRDNGTACCAQHNALAAADHCKKRLKEAGLHGEGLVRVNRAGCLGRCSAGPVAVVYPEGVWYSDVDLADVDEIIDTHLINGRVVERLLVPAGAGE